MSMIWAGAVEIALAWAVILGVKIASNAFEWKFEHLLPNYWYPVVKRKLAKPETATLKDKGIPKKISDELEGLLAFMQGGSLQNSRIRMDRTFQDKIEHETKQLKKRGLARQFHFTNLKLSEKNEKKKDFRHWSDAGREWREVIVEASVSDKYLSKDKKKVLHETIYPYGAILLRQSRHIRHTDKADKDRKKEQTFYSEYSQMTCPSCGAQLNLKRNELSLLWRLYTESILRLADRRFSNLSPSGSECKESVIHRRTDPGTIFTGSSMYTLHLKYVSCIWSCICIDHFSSFWNALFHNSEIRERGKVERTDYPI